MKIPFQHNNKLYQHNQEYINIHNGNMSGEIETADDGLLFLSIPYDKGWTILVDGEKQEINEAFDAFCSIKLEKT